MSDKTEIINVAHEIIERHRKDFMKYDLGMTDDSIRLHTQMPEKSWIYDAVIEAMLKGWQG